MYACDYTSNNNNTEARSAFTDIICILFLSMNLCEGLVTLLLAHTADLTLCFLLSKSWFSFLSLGILLCVLHTQVGCTVGALKEAAPHTLLLPGICRILQIITL